MERQFKRNLLVLLSGTAAARAVGLLVAPLLTRLYSPDAFGILAVYAAVTAILIVMAGLRYEMAVPLPKSDSAASYALLSALGATVLLTLSIAVVSTAWGDPLSAFANVPQLGQYHYLIPIGVFAGGCYNAMSYWLLRKHHFADLSRTKVSQGFGQAAISVGTGFLLGGAPAGLLWGQIASQAAGLSRLCRVAWREHPGRSLKRFRRRRLSWALQRYRQFPLVATWSGVANTIGQQLPLLMFAALFSPATAGLFMLAHRLTSAPMKLIQQTVSQVFFSTAAQSRAAGELDRISISTFRGLLRVGCPPLLMLAFIGPDVFGLLFGQEWAPAGTYVRWVALWTLSTFIFSPLIWVRTILEMHASLLTYQVLLVGGRALGLMAGYWLSDPVYAVALFVSIGCLLDICFGLDSLRRTGLSVTRCLRLLIQELGIALLGGLLYLGLQQIWLSQPGLGSSHQAWLSLVVGAALTAALTIWRGVPLLKNRRGTASQNTRKGDKQT